MENSQSRNLHFGFPEKGSLAEATRRRYLRFSENLFKEFSSREENAGRTLSDRLLLLPECFDKRTKGRSKSEFRFAKAALQHWLSTLTDPVATQTARAIALMPQTECKRRQSIHLKKLRLAHKAALEARLREQGKWKHRAWLMLNAIDLTGLRPIEWKNASYNPATRLLSVSNAKHSNGRGGVGERTMRLDTEEAHLAVIEHLVEMRGLTREGYPADMYQQNCSRMITKMAREIWPRRKQRPRLYSARHQFAADNKRAGRSLSEIAILMGHSSTNTVRAHYGRTTAGYKPPVVSPVLEPSAEPLVRPTRRPRF